jgi:CxxC motif-containing protein (DUF1111 family)
MTRARTPRSSGRRWGRIRTVALTAGLTAVAACSSGSTGSSDDVPKTRDAAIGVERSGGKATVFDTSANAFATAIPSLDRIERRAFSVGNSFFNDNWVTAPASTEGRDGLGPLFNAQSCSSCHFHDGRGKPPEGDDDPERGLLLRLSVPGAGPHGGVVPDPAYGDQLQDRAISGVPAEGRISITTEKVRGRYADGTSFTLVAPTYAITETGYGPLASDVQLSPRIAPAVFGVGLLEAVPAETVLEHADPDDADRDGISGTANRVLDVRTQHMVLGRFGWKSNVPTVEQQNAGAFNGDIGITSSLFPEKSCTAVETACLSAPTGGDPEVDDQKLGRVTFYTRTLAVPARRGADESAVRDGEQLFRSAGCSACHLPTTQTGPSDIPALADQTIHPFTDLLLHDMGPGLADDRPDGLATGSEWRTAPLWGIGLVDTVNRHTRFLHDGRARNLSEAILWHAGEAQPAKQRFRTMSRRDRAAIIAYLESL